MTEPTSSAAAPAPLTPPEPSTLTLTAPAPPPSIVATQAPAMAPQVDPASVPALDGKVDGYMGALMAAADPLARVRTAGRERPQHGRRRHPQVGRDLQSAAQDPRPSTQGGRAGKGSKVGSTLLELRRTVEDLDPKEATGAEKFLGMIPFGDGRSTTSASTVGAGPPRRDPARLREGQDELGKDNVALNLEKQQLWDAHGPAQPVRLRRRAARRAARRGHRRARAHRP